VIAFFVGIGIIALIDKLVPSYENPHELQTMDDMHQDKGEKKKLKSIPGAPPRLILPPKGCRFEPRCEHAMEVCKSEDPMTREKDNHVVACHLIS